MTEQEFKNLKPGDWVKCMQSCGTNYTKGKIYIISPRQDYKAGWVRTEIDDNGLKTNGGMPIIFELANFERDFKKMINE